SALFENPCKVYYQAIDNRYNYLVAPSKVLTKQFSRIVVEPLGDLGEAFGKFGRRMFTALPWGLNMVIFPIMLVVSCIIIFIVFLFISKPHFKLTLFHLFTIEMGQPVRNEGAHRSIQRINERAIREVGYDAGHRALVEETSNDNSSSYDENQSHPENNIQKQIGANKDENGINQKTLQQEPEPDTNNSTSVDNLGSNV
ncbi:MCLC domain containing protein, partial [Asbolus verrucosus]